MAITPELYGSSAPVLHVEGERMAALARDLLRLEVTEDTQGMKRLAMRFTAWGAGASGTDADWLHLDGQALDFGKRIEVSLGAAADARTVFNGRISALETEIREGIEPQLLVFAEDALMPLRWMQRCKTWEDSSDADIVRFLAGEHGLTPEIDADGPTHAVVQQWNQSDLAFLRERARLLQAELWVDGETLHFATRERRPAPEITLVNGNTRGGQAGNKLLMLNARADLAHQRSEVHVGGYDVSAREAIDESAAADVVRAEAGPGRLGAELLGQAFSSFKGHRLREVPLGSEAARSWARAELLRRARGFVRIQGQTNGSPDLVVGASLTLEGVGPMFGGGRYRVTQLVHSYDLTHGHRTAFQAERPNLELQ
ncbi:MAG: contractile injection system protein, VgrG/Pvc8 family [Rubrivivax sp.]|nr:contractile injection system protein, VgrG/Pvc8 family [Rubrivivax sp.]